MVLTAVITVTGVATAILFQQQLTLMQRQLDAMVFDQRPWVAAEIKTAKPLVLDTERSRAVLWLEIRLRNKGKTPAIGIAKRVARALDGKWELNRLDDDWLFFDGKAELQKTCGDERSLSAVGATIFPDQEDGELLPVEYPSTLPLSRETLPKFIAVCVDYSRSGDKSIYRTAQLFELGFPDVPAQAEQPVELTPIGALAD